MPWWISRLVEGYLDVVCTTVNESVKTVLHEVWSLSGQVVNGTSAVLLGFLHKPSYKKHLEHKERIIKRVVRSPAKGRRHSIFSELVAEDEVDKDGNEEETPTSKLDDWLSKQEEKSEPPRSPRMGSPGLMGMRERIRSRRKNNRSIPRTNSVPSLQNLNDLAHYHEHMTTGLVEDLFTNLLVFVDRVFLRIRLFVRSCIEAISFSGLTSFITCKLPFVLNPLNWIRKIMRGYQKVKKVPEKLVSYNQLDVRRVQDIIEHLGYPYEEHKVTTEDGYVLLLERIPNRASKHVLYLQHGIFDSAFAWVATGAAALAFRSHDQGFDVFLGNFRGNNDREHLRKNIKEAEYWDFSINEHAFKDYPAFINHIMQIKNAEFASPIKPYNSLPKTIPVPLSETALAHLNESLINMSLRRGAKKEEKFNNKEGGGARAREREREREREEWEREHDKQEGTGEDSPIKITVVSHSMGACATLMYIVQCRMQNIPHHLSQAILLSPAGYHQKVPWICDLLGPLINLWLYFVPTSKFYVFRFPSDSVRIWTAKAFHDLMNSGALAGLAAFLFSRLLFGGDVKDHPVTKVHNLAYNTFTGTSVRTYKHFWQMYKAKRFQAYDFGEARNREVYGQPQPVDFLKNYDKIDIPIHFCVGLLDNLIGPVNVIHQYNVLREAHPELAFLKACKNGHLEFTLGLDEPLLEYIMEVLALDKKTS